MTQPEALAEAKRRWGPEALAFSAHDVCIVGYFAGRGSLTTWIEKGTGKTYEDALRAAE